MSLLAFVLAAIAQRTVFTDGQWAVFDRGASCAAVTRATRIASDHSAQAYAGFTFDRAGTRYGQFAARLSHPLRAGSTVILTIGAQPFLLAANANFAWSRGPAQEVAIVAALRNATTMRIEARSSGGRFIDSYGLDGAPG
ncbi:MAG: hypothetical protein ABR588_08765, partial [Sphingomicrobium sp.]|nr:hypothetical protein [Sphingomonadales bacterium]